MKKLIREICKREGKKSQVSIGNVREVLRVLTDVLTDEHNDGFRELNNEFFLVIRKKFEKRGKINARKNKRSSGVVKVKAHK